MASSLQGAKSAFEELYERYARRMLGFTHRLLRDHQEAESITQEVFLRLLKDSAAYDPSRCFSTWIYKIARNLCLDALARRRPEGLDDPDCFISQEPNPAAVSEDRETVERLKVAIDALPPFCRQVLLLRIFDELSYRQIADIVGCPESTARSRMDLAIRRLRAHLCKNLEVVENPVDESPSRS
ncbi:MAG: sigma-70 family RNA polymerase sigma factor [Planctomycetes bacterium]|nr:sigma-70 family RNA polymerase sigma factor [Planctomycetota bacterium]MBL7040681.1 sigma-70 family RNA polymerase sigma factor [Pirellulaceae bacterium]